MAKHYLTMAFQGEKRERFIAEDENLASVLDDLKGNKAVSEITVYRMEPVENYTRPSEPSSGSTKDVQSMAPEANVTVS